jgi:iron complex transport system substrate-binding protein
VSALPRRRKIRVLAIGILSAVALTGCAATAAPSASLGPTAPRTKALSIDNCGTTVTFPKTAPKRVVTIKSTSTEMLLALGLGNRIVGTAFQDGPVPAQWKAQAAKLPVLSSNVPSQEVTLAAEPDLIYAGWESNLSADGAGTRSDLQSLGISTYVSPSACKEVGYQPAKLSFTDVFDEIGQVAKIFHVSDRKVLADQRATLASIHKDTRGLTALWFSSGSSTPYVGAGIGAPQLIMNTIGLGNIAASVKDTWTSFNWESVVQDNPDVIVLVDASWSTAAKKMSLLEGNPATANLPAVKNHRYLIVPFAASEAGVRTASAAKDLSAQLAKINLK